MIEPPVFTPKTLAERWDCSVWTIRGLIHDNKLLAFRVGHEFRITAEEVRRYEGAKATV